MAGQQTIMKILRRRVGLFATVLMSATAATRLMAADAGWYLKTEVGPSFVNNISTTSTDFGITTTTRSDFKTGVRFDFGGGYEFANSLAIETVTGIIYNEVDFSNSSGTTSPALYQLPFMINVIYTLPVDWVVKPYFGGGLGIVFTGLNDLGDVAGAGQLMAGAKYELNRHVGFELGYKLLATGEHDWADLFGTSHSTRSITQSIQAGVTYKF
jgi:opacity protein-like surface antigen